MRIVSYVNLIGLLAGNVSAADYCDKTSVQQLFDRAGIVVLAKVTRSTYPPDMETNERKVSAFNGTATLVTTQTWKGSYSPGTEIYAGPPDGFVSGIWNPRPVHIGDELLVFAERLNPVWLDYCSVTDKAQSASRLAFLDLI